MKKIGISLIVFGVLNILPALYELYRWVFTGVAIWDGNTFILFLISTVTVLQGASMIISRLGGLDD